MHVSLVFLPATEPGDQTFGTAPRRLGAWPSAAVRHVVFPAMVWYNRTVRQQVIAQMRAWPETTLVLIAPPGLLTGS